MVHTSACTPAAFTSASMRSRFVCRLRAAAVRNGESEAITVCPIICSISVRFSSAPLRSMPSTAWTSASPRAARMSGSTHVGCVPDALIEAVP